MAHHLRFSIAQPITIVGFTVSSGLLIADLIALSVSSTYQLPADSPAASAAHHALTSAFYYAIMAAAIYLIIASLMCLTVWGAYKGHYARHFNLTAAQRTLMLQTMSFFTYLLLGALVFSHVEKWEYLDAVYWADVTLLTVGLGDYSYVALGTRHVKSKLTKDNTDRALTWAVRCSSLSPLVALSSSVWSLAQSEPWSWSEDRRRSRHA